MYVHHLRSVHHIQVITINTKKAFNGICNTHIQSMRRLPQTKAAAYVILITMFNCDN
jgi:hypothetical protein